MGTAQVICLKTVRAFEKGEQPAKTTENPDMDSFSKQLLSRGARWRATGLLPGCH